MFVRDRVEVAFEVCIHDVEVTLVEQFLYPAESIFASSPRPEAVAVLGKVTLEDGFQYIADRCLDNPVSNRWDSQWPFLPRPRFRYPSSFNRLGSVGAVLQRSTEVSGTQLETLGLGERQGVCYPY